MRRTSKLFAGLIVAGFASAGLAAQAAETVQRPGTSPAYEQLGKVAVMHEGRIKPLDTVAREEVKQVYGKETVVVRDPREEVEKIVDPESFNRPGATSWTVEKWGPVAAFLGWTVRPEFWDDQPFILVDYLPLRRVVMAGTIKARLEAIAQKSTCPEGEKDRLRKLAVAPDVTATALIAFARDSKLPIEDRRTIAELAARLTEEHKWLAPRELEEARITAKGQELPFMSWAAALEKQKRDFDNNPQAAERPTEIERRAIEVAHRLGTYLAYSGDQFSNAGLILVMPRPSDAKYLAYTAGAIKEARAAKRTEDLPLMKLDALRAIGTYWDVIPVEDHKTPTEDAAADERFAAWLRDSSAWVPLKTLLKSKPEDLVAAGYPEGPVKAFLDAYHALEQAEISSPGQVSEAAAAALLTASRSLGEAVNPTKYPTVAMIDRETHFNAMNPFWQAPIAYGTALALLAVSLGFIPAAGKRSMSALLGSTIYRFGLAALAIGIALEIYGFYLRVRITGWAPVTNMYETVIWVALVAAVLSFVFEMIYRRVYMALAGSGVAL